MLILLVFIIPRKAASFLWDLHPIAFFGFCAPFVAATQWSKADEGFGFFYYFFFYFLTQIWGFFIYKELLRCILLGL